MATTDIRTKGAFTYANISYDTTAKQPLDARMLVPSFAALTNAANWATVLPTGANATLAYNGMIVAVADKNDATHNGIYVLIDYVSKKNPDTTKSENWHKIANLAELDSLAERVEALENKNPEIDYNTLIEELKKELVTLESFNTYTTATDSAIAALQSSTQNNAAAIAALVGTDSNKSVRDIIDSSVAEVVKNDKNYASIEALVHQVIDNTSAIGALTGTGDQSIGDIAVEAVEEEIKNADAGYESIQALVKDVQSGAIHVANAEVQLHSLLGDKYYGDTKYLGEIVADEISAAAASYDKDAVSDTLDSIAALTHTTIQSRDQLAALLANLDEQVVEEIENLISDKAEFIIEEKADGSKQLRINELELSKIIHTDGTTIVIHGGNASGINIR